MELAMVPMLQCTSVEFKTEIEPIIKMLDDLDLCPLRNEKRSTNLDCNAFEDCNYCPFGEANTKIREALEILKGIEVKLK